MLKVKLALLSLGCLGLLAACGEQKRDVKDTVFAAQVKALERAREVEGKLQQGAEKNRAALESSENPDAAQKSPQRR